MRLAGYRRLVLILLLFFTAAVDCETAVGQVGTAAVTGELREEQSAAIPGATVTLVNDATGAERDRVVPRPMRGLTPAR